MVANSLCSHRASRPHTWCCWLSSWLQNAPVHARIWGSQTVHSPHPAFWNLLHEYQQLWQRTPTENPVQRIHLQLSLWLYRGHKARSYSNSKPYTCRTPHRTPWGSRWDGWPQQLCKVKEQPSWNAHGSSWISGLAVGQSFLSNTLEIFSAFRQDQ